MAPAADSEWTLSTHFAITIVNTVNPSRSVRQETNRVFQTGNRDWGFQEMMPISELYAPESGYLSLNTMTMEIDIRVITQTLPEAPPPVVSTRQRKKHVGLVNLGATCYLNSLLQMLFHLRYFRRAMYNMPPPEGPDVFAKPTLTFALQRLFHALQYGTESCSPSELVHTFGWAQKDVFQQHDVQEMCRMLLDKISTATKSTAASGIVDMLFKGSILHTVECVKVEYRSALEEDFYDVQLNVKGCRNVYESFTEYVAVESLDGQNKYFADIHGLQVARKAACFKTFPNVLVLHLKRFEFDASSEQLRKVNDYYEFYATIRLDRYLMSAQTSGRRKHNKSTDDGDDKNEFILHSVLVHSGSMSSGHYVVYCRPDGQAWYKFDDRNVTSSTSYEAITANYGKGSTRDGDHNSNAYMLVYVRKASWNSLQKDLKETDFPNSLRDCIQRSMSRSTGVGPADQSHEMNPLCDVRVMTTEHLARDASSHSLFVEADTMPLKVPRSMPFEQFCETVTANYSIPADRQVYWLFEDRLNGQRRPSRMVGVPTATMTMTVETVFRMDRMTHFSNSVVVFLQQAAGPSACRVEGFDGALLSSDSGIAEQVLVFYKIFNGDTLVTTICKLTNATVPFLTVMSDPENPFDLRDVPDVFEEIRPSVMERVDTALSLSQLGVTDGDVLLLFSHRGGVSDGADGHATDGGPQPDGTPLNWTVTNEDDVLCNLEPSALCDGGGAPLLLTAANVPLRLCSFRQPDVVSCHTQFSRLIPMTDVIQRVALLLRVQAKDLVLYSQNTAWAPHGIPVPISADVTLRDVLHAEWDVRTNVMYYDLRWGGPPVGDGHTPECRMSCAVSWLPLDHLAPASHFQMSFLAKSSIGDALLEAVLRARLLTDDSKGGAGAPLLLRRLRLVEVSTRHCEVVHVYNHNAPCQGLAHHCVASSRHLTLRMDEVRPEDDGLPLAVLRYGPPLGATAPRILQVLSVTVDVALQCVSHSHPVLVAVRPTDTFDGLRQRLSGARHDSTGRDRWALVIVVNRKALSRSHPDSDNVLDALRRSRTDAAATHLGRVLDVSLGLVRPEPIGQLLKHR